MEKCLYLSITKSIKNSNDYHIGGVVQLAKRKKKKTALGKGYIKKECVMLNPTTQKIAMNKR